MAAREKRYREFEITAIVQFSDDTEEHAARKVTLIRDVLNRIARVISVSPARDLG